MISASVEEYLEAIYRLGEEARPVALSNLAEKLNISSVSANQMVRRLVQRKLVLYEPYKGVSLTPTGQAGALTVIRRHRLWERFLTDALGLPWDKVHDEACHLEHATSPLVEQRLEQYLEEPKTCPHGHPVPIREGGMVVQTGCPLTGLEPGQAGVVLCVPEQDTDMLQYMASLGLQPDVTVEVESVAPFEGPVTVRVGEARRALGRDVASQIMVRPL